MIIQVYLVSLLAETYLNLSKPNLTMLDVSISTLKVVRRGGNVDELADLIHSRQHYIIL